MGSSIAKKSIEIFARYGTVALLAAYLLISFNLLGNSLLYQLINLAGSAGLAVILFVRKVWQPVILEVIWVIAAISLLFMVM